MDCPDKVGFDLCGKCFDRGLHITGRFNQQHTAGDGSRRSLMLPAALQIMALVGYIMRCCRRARTCGQLCHAARHIRPFVLLHEAAYASGFCPLLKCPTHRGQACPHKPVLLIAGMTCFAQLLASCPEAGDTCHQAALLTLLASCRPCHGLGAAAADDVPHLSGALCLQLHADSGAHLVQ